MAFTCNFPEGRVRGLNKNPNVLSRSLEHMKSRCCTDVFMLQGCLAILPQDFGPR